tara:strand:- start:17102 stop:17668 length:567 start_codon:yes stop_codon:yes gene_type:complete
MDTKKKKPTFTKEELNAGDLTFHYWGALNNLYALIRSSELKAGLILSFFGIIFNFVYQNIERVKENLTDYSFLYILLSLWLISTLISIYHSVNTFIPRIEKNYDPNVFFFGDIISKFGDIHQFSHTFLKTNVDKEKIYTQIGQQVYVNAKITALKFKRVNASIRYLVISLTLLGLLIVSEIVIMLFLK